MHKIFGFPEPSLDMCLAPGEEFAVVSRKLVVQLHPLQLGHHLALSCWFCHTVG